MKTNLLYLLLGAFVIPLFFQGGKGEFVIKTDRIAVTEQELGRATEVLKQLVNPDLARPYAVSSYYLYGKSKAPIWQQLTKQGLTVSDTAVSHFITHLPLAQLGGKFNQDQYESMLRSLRMNDATLSNYIHVWLIAKQMMLPIELYVESDHIKRTIANVKKAFEQERIGTYQEIKLADYKPTFSQEELLELESFFINKKPKSPLYARFYGVYLEPSKTNELVEGLRARQSLSKLANKLNLREFHVTCKDGKIIANNITSQTIVKQLQEQMKAALVGEPLVAQDQLSKVVFVLQEFIQPKTYSIDYFKSEVLPAWSQKDEKHPIIKSWVQHKRLQMTIAQEHKLSEGQKISAVLNDIDQLGIMAPEQHLSKAMFAISKTLFDLKPGEQTTIQSDDSVFIVKLDKINRRDLSADIEANIKDYIKIQLIYNLALKK